MTRGATRGRGKPVDNNPPRNSRVDQLNRRTGGLNARRTSSPGNLRPSSIFKIKNNHLIT